MDEETRKALEELTGVVTAVGERQVSLEDRIKAVETPSTDSSEKPARLQELETKNAELLRKAEAYESPAYADEIIRRWARGLTPESYIALGVKLGFQEVLAEEVGEVTEHLDEVQLADGPRVMFSDTLPEGEEGWQRSESLGCFVKVQPAPVRILN